MKKTNEAKMAAGVIDLLKKGKIPPVAIIIVSQMPDAVGKWWAELSNSISLSNLYPDAPKVTKSGPMARESKAKVITKFSAPKSTGEAFRRAIEASTSAKITKVSDVEPQRSGRVRQDNALHNKLGKWALGWKQSPDHIAKRVAATQRTVALRKAGLL